MHAQRGRDPSLNGYGGAYDDCDNSSDRYNDAHDDCDNYGDRYDNAYGDCDNHARLRGAMLRHDAARVVRGPMHHHDHDDLRRPLQHHSDPVMRGTLLDGRAGVLRGIMWPLGAALDADGDGNGNTGRDTYGSRDSNAPDAGGYGDGRRHALHEAASNTAGRVRRLLHDDHDDDVDVLRCLHGDDRIGLCRLLPKHTRCGRSQRCTADAPPGFHGDGRR